MDVVKANMPKHIVDSLSTPKYIVFVMSMSTKSHSKPFVAIANKLVERGHEVAVASVYDFALDFFKDDGPFKKLIILKSTKEYHAKTKEEEAAAREEVQQAHWDLKWSTTGHNGLGEWNMMLNFDIKLTYEGEYLSLRDECQIRRPDLIVCDWLAMNAQEFAKFNGIPVVIFSALANFPFWPECPSYIPSTVSGKTPYSMSLWDRTVETFFGSVLYWYHLLGPTIRLNRARAIVGAKRSMDLAEPRKRTPIFVFNYRGFEVPRYMSPFTHILGPIVLKDEQVMDDDLKQWLDGIAKRGEAVIYMGMGSVASFPVDTVRALLAGLLYDSPRNITMEYFHSKEGFRKKVHLLWAHNKTDPRTVLSPEIFANPEKFNLKLIKWSPQVKVLNHPAVKLFLSHGGAESIFESHLAGKPVLVFPQFGDQAVNGLRAAELGFGSGLDFTTSPIKLAKEVSQKSKQLLEAYDTNPNFRRKLEDLSKVVYYNSQKYEYAVDLMEMEMRVGSDHIQLVEDDWSFCRRYNLDIIASVAFLTLAASFGFRYASRV